jgi:hypothetical protein
MEVFSKAGERLREWAIQIRDARAEVIADMTKEAIRDLASERYFSLPGKFTSYIEDYERQEGALQSIADYRDHFVHPFHVFCLGYHILYRWAEELQANRIKGMPLNLTQNQDVDHNLRLWFVASVYHDVGFPAERLEVLIHDFFKITAGRELRSQFDWSSVILAHDNIKYIRRLRDLFGRKSRNQDVGSDKFEKWFHKRLLEDHDHGVLTALMLLNQGWQQSKQEENTADEAALAIALHSYRRNSKEGESPDFDIGPLAVEDFPLAFFLSYCDCAQEWGRKVLLELIKKSARVGRSDSVQYSNGLDTKLQAPVASISREMLDGGVRVRTTVTIKYPTGPDTPIRGGETLEEVFRGVAEGFASTWYLENQKETDFCIQGNDVDDLPLGHIHPAPRLMLDNRK